jgi:uncharacterized protein
MSHFTPVSAVLGGILLGTASSLLFTLNGRILGVSGIVGGLPSAPADDRLWRAFFVGGLLVGGLGLLMVDPAALPAPSEQTVGIAVVAGVLVGAGTRWSNGCTSGHGLCGLARLSKRSLVATLVFMAMAMLTVFFMRHVLSRGGPS